MPSCSGSRMQRLKKARMGLIGGWNGALNYIPYSQAAHCFRGRCGSRIEVQTCQFIDSKPCWAICKSILDFFLTLLLCAGTCYCSGFAEVFRTPCQPVDTRTVFLLCCRRFAPLCIPCFRRNRLVHCAANG